MTKHRTKLKKEHLEQLAELRMHLRDEELREGTLRTRVEKRFPSASQSQPVSATDGNAIDSEAQSESEDNSPEESADTRRHRSLREFIDGFQQLSRNDDVNDAVVPGAGKVTLAELLDFTNPYWAGNQAAPGLADEMAIHETLEQESRMFSDGDVPDIDEIEDELDH